MMDTITDVFFDLDHTLWDFDHNSGLVFETILKNDFPDIAFQQFTQIYTPINQSCWKLYQSDLISHDELRYRRLKQTFEALAYPVSDTTIETIATQYMNRLTDYNHLIEGALAIVTYLQSKYTLHIITNGIAEVQHKKLQNSGLQSYFTTVTDADTAGVKKPHPAIYALAITNAKTTKEQSVMIGDCIEADYYGALNFGMHAILYDQGTEHSDDKVTRIGHLMDLKKIL